MKLSKELFVIPYENEFILFEPVIGSIIKVNMAAIEMLRGFSTGLTELENDFKTLLIKAKILVEDEKDNAQEFIGGKFEPTAVTLFPTFDCNLRCIYCYSNAGINKGIMTSDIAEAAVLMVIRNAQRLRAETITLGFHGGGEPFFGKGWLLMKDVVEFAKDECCRVGIGLKVSAATNGVLNREQLDWILGNVNSLNLSIDGPPEIQNSQRPLANGHASSLFVERTMRYLEERGYKFGVRCTVTDKTCDKLGYLISYFVRFKTISVIHLEPLYECGRCLTTETHKPNYEKFAEEYLKLKSSNPNLNVYYSGFVFGEPKKIYCGAVGDNFVVTPDGYVSTCFEVSSVKDHRSRIFFVGKFNSQKRSFQINHEKILFLNSREVDAIEDCKECFAKYGCAGDCPAKSANLGDIFDVSNNPRCAANKIIALDEIIRRSTGHFQDSIDKK